MLFRYLASLEKSLTTDTPHITTELPEFHNCNYSKINLCKQKKLTWRVSHGYEKVSASYCAQINRKTTAAQKGRGQREKNKLLINKQTAKSTKSIWSPRFSNNKQKQTPQITFGWECLLLLLFLLLLLLLLLLRFTHLVPAASGDDDGNGGCCCCCCCSVSLLIRSKQLRGHITNMAKKASKKSETRIIMTTILATIMNKSCCCLKQSECATRARQRERERQR